MSAPLMITLYTLINGLTRNIYQVLFNLYLKNLGYNNEIVGTIMSYNLWGGAILGLLIGFLADKFGRKKVILFTQIFIVIFGIWRLFPTSFLSLYITSFLYGGFNVTSRILSNVFLVDYTHYGNRAKFFGLNFGTVMFTGVIGNALGGMLGDLFGFKSIMILAMLLRIFALVPIWSLKENTRRSNIKIKLTGYQKKVFAYYLFSTMSVGFGAGLFIHFGNVIFYDLFSMSATLIGFVLALAQFGTSLGATFSHKLGKKFGAAKLLLISHFSVPILILLMAFIREPVSFTSIYIARFTIMNMVNPIFSTLILSFLPSNILASTSGLNNFVNNAMRGVAAILFANITRTLNGYWVIFLISSIFYLANALVTLQFYKHINGRDKKLYSN
ncbi:MFS transporter [Thermosipho ferrireducens]|uniref:MFS transporter n=1 Tax=Thermosipho ferrireducens TaxID=2571116 RepID=A0ABX7S667_9BACT|nr:MFS transporter [Thermosipho ferrireducens]QTA38068.1 MFS transporter [Thermosipho ferrireducens]